MNTIVRATWPGRIHDTQESLPNVINDPAALIPEGMKDIPKSFEVLAICDLGAKFKGSKVFVESLIEVVPQYYKEIGENLSKWVPSAPKVKETPKIEEEGGIDRSDSLGDTVKDELDSHYNQEQSEGVNTMVESRFPNASLD